jgi:hypothetical protein
MGSEVEERKARDPDQSSERTGGSTWYDFPVTFHISRTNFDSHHAFILTVKRPFSAGSKADTDVASNNKVTHPYLRFKKVDR